MSDDEDDKSQSSWPYRLELGWQHLSLSLRTLVLIELFLARGNEPSLPDNFQQLSAYQLKDYVKGMDGTVTVRIRPRHSPEALRRMQQLESLKEEFLRKGASAEIMQWLFRISKRQVQDMRRRLGLKNAATGRPRRLDREREYEIFAAWERMRDQGMLYPQIMLSLSEQYPDVGMASLYAVIRRAI